MDRPNGLHPQRKDFDNYILLFKIDYFILFLQ